MAVKKRLVDLTINELKGVLKKKGLSEFGEKNELLARLRQAMSEKRSRPMHSSVSTDGSGTRDEKTASSNDERNTSGMLEDLDLEVVLDDFEGGGGARSGYGGKEGVSGTPGASGENRGERKESDFGGKTISKETTRPLTTLWISGLASTAKATDLKQLFSQHGQVIGAKVVASSKSESKRFGIVTMSTAEEAQACIENVNNTEFLENLITVELDPKQRNAGGSSQPVTETDSKQDDLASSASLWISGLATTAKAADLKEMCVKYGEVVQAKVVASSKNPDSKCYYGIVTMSTSEEANCCIEKLNQTEVNGQVITVEKRKQDSSSKSKASSRPESSPSSFYSRRPFDRDRFSGGRGFRGRSFPPRPFMGRGRDSGYRGRGRGAFEYMDHIRADYERQMFHDQRMRDGGGDQRHYMPEFRGGRGRFPGRSRPPYERPWNDRRGGGFRRDIPNNYNEPYWGQAAKRPRMDDQKTGEAEQFGELGNRLPVEGGGGKWNSGNQGDKNQPYCEPYNAPSQDKGFDANISKKGNNGNSYNQWQSGVADNTTNSSGTYQAGNVMYSNYDASQSYSSGPDTSAGGAYMGADSSHYTSTTGTSTYGTAGGNLYSNTGGSYSGKESSSYIGTVTSTYSSAGGGTYGGPSSYSASGSTSYQTTGSGSYPTTGSSYYHDSGSSSYPAGGNSSYGGGATGSSYGATASSSYPPAEADAYGTGNSSYGATYTSSYSAPGSSSYGTGYAAPASTTYSASSVSYQGTGSYATQQGATSYGGTTADAAYAGNTGGSSGTGNSQAQYDTYKQQGSGQSYSWY